MAKYRDLQLITNLLRNKFALKVKLVYCLNSLDFMFLELGQRFNKVQQISATATSDSWIFKNVLGLEFYFSHSRNFQDFQGLWEPIKTNHTVILPLYGHLPPNRTWEFSL